MDGRAQDVSQRDFNTTTTEGQTSIPPSTLPRLPLSPLLSSVSIPLFFCLTRLIGDHLRAACLSRQSHSFHYPSLYSYTFGVSFYFSSPSNHPDHASRNPSFFFPAERIDLPSRDFNWTREVPIGSTSWIFSVSTSGDDGLPS